MNPRLRSMVVDEKHTVLVVDRFDRGVLTPEKVAKIADIGKHVGVAGTLVFDFEIDLPDDESEGLTIHPDELAALRGAVHLLVNNADMFGTAQGVALREIVDPLQLLIQRAEQ